MQPKPPRPTGVTILAILAILVGLGLLLLGGGLLAVSAILGTLDLSAAYPQLAAYGLTVDTIATLIAIFGAVFLIIGILDIAVAVGFLGGKGWAWTLGMIVAVLNVIGGILSVLTFSLGGVVFLLIWIAILYYLTRPHVKTFFGRVPMIGTAMGSGTMAASTMGSGISPSASSAMMRCPHCGANVAPGTTKCPSCGGAI